jgi:hypothetical protein
MNTTDSGDHEHLPAVAALFAAACFRVAGVVATGTRMSWPA